MSSILDKEPLLRKGEAPVTYIYRWVILVIFCLANMSNGMIWVTFSPISDIASNYFHGGAFGSATAINMLGSVFLIFYIPGTILASVSMKRYKLRKTVIIGSLFTVMAALMRYIATLCYSSADIATVYSLMLFGQILAAIGQPLLLNIPPVISAGWFPVGERDVAITIGAMCNSVGNAIGNVIPVELVTQSKKNGSDDDYTVHGMDNLMLTEFVLCVVPLVLAVVYFKDAPPTPPSLSTMHKLDAARAKKAAAVTLYTEENDLEESLDRIRLSSTSGMAVYSVLWDECMQLARNFHYVILFTSFSCGMGFFCAFLTLLNQIILPFGYSNKAAGTFGVVFIVAGLAGAAVSSIVMQRTRAYRVILKIVTFLSMMSSLLFVLMLFDNNYWPLLFSVACMGFLVMPILPVSLENCAECTYPLPEDLSVGILNIGQNVLGLPFIFGLQEILNAKDLGNKQLTPANIFIFGMLFFCFVVTLFYNGEYKRSQKEGHAYGSVSKEEG